MLRMQGDRVLRLSAPPAAAKGLAAAAGRAASRRGRRGRPDALRPSCVRSHARDEVECQGLTTRCRARRAIPETYRPRCARQPFAAQPAGGTGAARARPFMECGGGPGSSGQIRHLHKGSRDPARRPISATLISAVPPVLTAVGRSAAPAALKAPAAAGPGDGKMIPFRQVLVFPRFVRVDKSALRDIFPTLSSVGRRSAVPFVFRTRWVP